LTEIQKQLIEMKPGQSATINGRWVAGTYSGWLIENGPGAWGPGCTRCTSLPEAAAELEGGRLTDAA
jgi:hypothetical protein